VSPTIASEPSLLLLPKNSGLRAQVEHALAERRPAAGETAYRLRGEDIANLSCQLAREGRDVAAYTGEDLLEEWLAAGNLLDARLKRTRIPWSDPNAIYGKPALCLIGAPERSLEKLRVASEAEKVRIAVCARYQNLAKRYLCELPLHDDVEITLVHGGLEAVLCERIADFIVDIVVTGKTIQDAGLSVREVFFKSDLVLLETQ